MNESVPPSNEEKYYQELYSECSEELGGVYDKPDKRTKNVVDWDIWPTLALPSALIGEIFVYHIFVPC